MQALKALHNNRYHWGVRSQATSCNPSVPRPRLKCNRATFKSRDHRYAPLYGFMHRFCVVNTHTYMILGEKSAC